MSGIAVVGMAIIIAGALIWQNWVRYELTPRNFGVVKEGCIYRSAQQTPRMLRQLCRDLKLKTIIDLGGTKQNHPRTQAQAAIASEAGIVRYALGLNGDGTGDPNKYVQALRIMADPACQPVLVHCSAGSERTTAAVLLYQHIVEGQPLEAVYPESFNYKHEPSDWKVLAYLADHLEEIRQSFLTGQPIGEDGGKQASRSAHAQAKRPG